MKSTLVTLLVQSLLSTFIYEMTIALNNEISAVLLTRASRPEVGPLNGFEILRLSLHLGWTECRATWIKGADGEMNQIKAIQQTLLFAIKGFDCDNSLVFLNWHLLRYFQTHQQPIQFTRSRPYHGHHTNDNARVEQQSWSCMRQLLGYERFANPRLVKAINDLYANEFSWLTNFFSPTMKLVEKMRVGAKIVKRYAAPETPAQRLLDHQSLTIDQKQRPIETQAALNPFVLRDII